MKNSNDYRGIGASDPRGLFNTQALQNSTDEVIQHKRVSRLMGVMKSVCKRVHNNDYWGAADSLRNSVKGISEEQGLNSLKLKPLNGTLEDALLFYKLREYSNAVSVLKYVREEILDCFHDSKCEKVALMYDQCT